MRHGETVWNTLGKPQGREDIPLNLEGMKQALSRQGLFSGHDLTVVVSPLIRARKSAELATGRANVKSFIVDERLIEYDFGSPTRKPEDINAFIKRIFRVLVDYAQDPGNVLIVTHGAVMGELLRLFLGPENQEEMLPLYNCSISVIDYDPGQGALSLRGINVEEEELETLLTENDG